MARAGVVATLLPIAAFYLKLGRFAPARALIDAGVPVALATDVNPGGGFSPSMPFAMTLACFAHGADVRGGARRRDDQRRMVARSRRRVGSLEPGKQMDAVLVHGDAIDLIRVGAPRSPRVIKGGYASSHGGNSPHTMRIVIRMTARPSCAVHRSLHRARSDRPSPTPGGGSASALAGAVGASLLAMVAACRSRARRREEDVSERLAAAERAAARSAIGSRR